MVSAMWLISRCASSPADVRPPLLQSRKALERPASYETNRYGAESLYQLYSWGPYSAALPPMQRALALAHSDEAKRTWP